MGSRAGAKRSSKQPGGQLQLFHTFFHCLLSKEV